MKGWFQTCLIFGLGMGQSVDAAAGADSLTKAVGVQLRMAESRGEADFIFKGQRLMLYVFASNQFKPYVKELHPLNGPNVLQDAPADHLHHHGLMYAIRLNGVNFWEEYGEPGVEKPIRFLKQHLGRDAEDRSWAEFTQLIHWVKGSDRGRADTASLALLQEERTLRLTVDEAKNEVALLWAARFQAGKPWDKVRLQGTDYNGLGLRLPKGLDHVAVFQNSESVPYSAAQQRDVIPARWSSAAPPPAGPSWMLALFGHKTNPGEGARFFSMRNPFAYLAVTQGLDQSPLDYGPDETFELHYLLTVYSQPKDRGFLERRWKRWQESAGEPTSTKQSPIKP